MLRLKPNAKPFSLPLGKKGECLACEHLCLKGYQILERNVECGFGEIDIVAKKKKTIVFLEVKTRSSDDLGRPEEAVDERKQKKLIQLAEYYLQKNTELQYETVRLDVIAVLWSGAGKPQIEHFENAFEKQDEI